MRTNAAKKVAWWIATITFTFAVAQTAYFGWNFWPQSNAEIVCDFIAAFFTGVAVGVWHTANWLESTP